MFARADNETGIQILFKNAGGCWPPAHRQGFVLAKARDVNEGGHTASTSRLQQSWRALAPHGLMPLGTSAAAANLRLPIQDPAGLSAAQAAAFAGWRGALAACLPDESARVRLQNRFDRLAR